MKPVRCVDCGLLSIRSPRTGMLEEVGERAREDGDGLNLTPLCAALVDLHSEIVIRTPQGATVDPMPAIRRERECEHFRAWRPGLSPKEHKMLAFEEESRAKDRPLILAVIGIAGSVVSAIMGTVVGWILGAHGK